MFKSINSLIIALLLCLSCKQTPETISLNDTGVPLDMATYRRSQVADVVYNLSFVIPEKKNLPIISRVTLELTVNDLSNPVYLDFKEDKNLISSVAVNENIIETIHEKEHLIIPLEVLQLGKNTIDIGFTAGELSLNRNDDYLYTLLVPDRARTVFPCFDQPDIKASYVVKIIAPSAWEVLCGAPLASKETAEAFTTYQFEASDKMSTYLFSFVAGQFEKVTSQDTKREMNMLYRETNEEKITASTARIFELHQSSLDFLEDYTQVDFPFKKFDFATIPGFQY